jgi:hypothetical protein
MDINIEINEIPTGVLEPCRKAGIPDQSIKTWYEDAFVLAIEEGRSTDFDDEEMVEHIIESFENNN